ncbi:sensor domain-containing diguanylate cyclase [Trichocoleus sp. FACHB-591]|uniref:GGDEF domain-containing protein n=1 Tax=Trichocoleus sp. FACHB-591 TaxID=2692872 RepID=UPI0016881ACA|nr:sensor domain-containing diguanylate cyclase [Trichocoleus sp. FACHB-591]MBD2094403.1 sensor domain-containing diguanylate cyclase [Trichocoleus sp. FACHB-591]
MGAATVQVSDPQMLQSRFRQPNWKSIYPLVEAAVINLASANSLLQQIVEAIAAEHQVECLLWTGFDPEVAEGIQVYGTDRALQSLKQELSLIPTLAETPGLILTAPPASESKIQICYLSKSPQWLLDQQHLSHAARLFGESLIVPAWNGDRLRFVLQLQRHLPQAATHLPAVETRRKPFLRTYFNPKAPTPQPTVAAAQAWMVEEVETLEVICSQVVLALNALHWRERLEQSRQQAALVGRIVRLLNSSLNPNEIVECIVAELGQGLNSDRCILVDLRGDPVHILAAWDHPERCFQPLENRHIARDLWQDTVEMFLQGAASYLELELSQQESDPLLNWLREIQAFAALIVPLFVQDEFFGAVLLLSYEKERVYELDELQTIRQVADQAAVALTNAQHYQSLWFKQETLRLQNNSLQLEVIHDELTQLLNRRSLERELAQLSAPAQWSLQPPFSVIVCDIDYFKLINDSYGHLVGDEVLYSLAQRLQKQLRFGTSAYRYGGEEFVILLMDVTIDRAFEVAERLRLAIRSTAFETTIGPLEISASFGVAQQDPTSDQDAWDTVQRADRALYEAKRQGRDRAIVL